MGSLGTILRLGLMLIIMSLVMKFFDTHKSPFHKSSTVELVPGKRCVEYYANNQIAPSGCLP